MHQRGLRRRRRCVAASALATAIPGFEPPTAYRLSTAALALCVLVAVLLFGIQGQGQGLLDCLSFCV